MVLIDLQKAFDTIDHQILLKKMKYLGFSENTITWFQSYICEWKFKISINTFTPVLSTYYVEFLKDLFQVHSCFYFT